MLDYVALVMLIVVFLILVYGVVAIHDIPYNIAKARNHPHQDAIHTAGWVSLFTLHAIWPFLWIWATLYRPDRGYGFGAADRGAGPNAAGIAALETRIQRIEAALAGGPGDVGASPRGPAPGQAGDPAPALARGPGETI